ncbi:MAG TPA: alpha-2-macroglobulin family protein, partial [Opitutaceae bacterium]|nr:alpha-2-macroglobulin family protein [Opitutaceae bacterium]
IRSYWTAPDHTQVLIEEPVTEAIRGGFTLRVSYVRENRAYLKERVVDVPWTNKQLHVKWESFRSKLLPGEKETWTAVVTGPAAKGATAEMVATLYDASLDQFLPHPWPDKFDVLRREFPLRYSQFQNSEIVLSDVRSWEAPEQRSPMWEYRSFPSEVLAGGSDRQMIMQSAFQVAASVETRGYYAANTLAGTRRAKIVDAAELSMPAVASPASGAMPSPVDSRGPAEEIPKPDLNQVAARRNLQETAFFFPHLVSDHDGVVRIEFTTPEALTTWRFLGFAHDAQLRSGFLTDTAVTAKDLMVEPNPPRFVREGDVIEFTVKVSNQTDKPQTGDVRLTFADAATQRSMDAALGNRSPEQRFEIPAKQSRTYSWRIAVPDGMGFLTYKAVGASAQASDGEEGYLPVLSRRVLVTESLPLPIRGEGTKQFEFPKLLESGGSPTLQNESLTVQMVSHPAWYAVMALPYLMEYPYECSEQVFNRLYANALARQVGNSDPKIRRVFDLWKNTPALDSPLQKNQDLKAIMLEDTPWLRDAQAESQARRNVGLLFDANRLDAETARAMRTLADRQLSDGLWSWFPGGRPSEYISLYIVTGFGRLRHLGVNVDAAPAVKALTALDAWIDDEYQRILKQPDPETYTPSYTDCLYLYGRSFFLRDQPIAATHQAAVDFLLKQAGKYWLQVGSRQCQAQLALGLQRFGDTATPLAIMRSLKELSITSEEMGMYWRDSGSSWWWYDAPIETQAMMIEAFGEVAHDAKAVEDCKVWLLKQKQTQDWGTTKATADAVYALLLRGSDLLASDQLVDVSLGGAQVKPDQVEAGTGFYEQRFVRGEIKPAMGHITVTKPDAGVSWGAVHWQYLEDMAKVSPHEGTPLQLKKALFVKRTTAKGQVLEPVTGPVHVGDELVVRIELRTDREMEYVHLKDQRGSGTEPVNVLSGYRYQDGLAYYESTRDTATDFFIDYLPRGTYVFEYPTRVQLKGRYQTGIAEIQCMYAPEFNSHSGSIEIEVR